MCYLLFILYQYICLFNNVYNIDLLVLPTVYILSIYLSVQQRLQHRPTCVTYCLYFINISVCSTTSTTSTCLCYLLFIFYQYICLFNNVYNIDLLVLPTVYILSIYLSVQQRLQHRPTCVTYCLYFINISVCSTTSTTSTCLYYLLFIFYQYICLFNNVYNIDLLVLPTVYILSIIISVCSTTSTTSTCLCYLLFIFHQYICLFNNVYNIDLLVLPTVYILSIIISVCSTTSATSTCFCYLLFICYQYICLFANDRCWQTMEKNHYVFQRPLSLIIANVSLRSLQCTILFVPRFDTKCPLDERFPYLIHQTDQSYERCPSNVERFMQFTVGSYQEEIEFGTQTPSDLQFEIAIARDIYRLL